MGIARHLEERLERLVDGVSAALFRGKMRPVDLGNRLVRLADLRVEQEWLGPVIPNVYRLWLAEADVGKVDADALAPLGRELGYILGATATESGWATRGPIEVTAETAEPGATKTTVEATSRPGKMRPWGQLMAIRSAEAHDLGDNRAGIGRGTDTEVRIQASEVSRHHAVVFRQGGRHWLHDAGSTNGTWRNRDRVGEDPVVIQPGDALRFGPVGFTFRIV